MDVRPLGPDRIQTGTAEATSDRLVARVALRGKVSDSPFPSVSVLFTVESAATAMPVIANIERTGCQAQRERAPASYLPHLPSVLQAPPPRKRCYASYS